MTDRFPNLRKAVLTVVRKVALTAAALFCLGGLIACANWRYYEAVRPVLSDSDLFAFAARRPAPVDIRMGTVGGEPHFAVIGPYPESRVLMQLRLPSGPPAYVFDGSGTLVDWTADVGDHDAFVRKWGDVLRGEVVPIERARKIIEQQQRKPPDGADATSPPGRERPGYQGAPAEPGLVAPFTGAFLSSPAIDRRAEPAAGHTRRSPQRSTISGVCRYRLPARSITTTP